LEAEVRGKGRIEHPEDRVENDGHPDSDGARTIAEAIARALRVPKATQVQLRCLLTSRRLPLSSNLNRVQVSVCANPIHWNNRFSRGRATIHAAGLTGKIQPWIAMWMPNLLLLAIGIYLLGRGRFETARSNASIFSIPEVRTWMSAGGCNRRRR